MEQYLTPSAALFSVGIFILTFIVRRMVEGVAPTLSKKTAPSRAQQVWEETILRILPPLLGMGLSLVMSDLMHPEMTKTSSRIWFGMVSGFFSTYAYMIVKVILKKTFSIKEPTGREGDSMSPKGATSDAPPPVEIPKEAPMLVIVEAPKEEPANTNDVDDAG